MDIVHSGEKVVEKRRNVISSKRGEIEITYQVRERLPSKRKGRKKVH